jgi:hypothetical protein
MATYAPGGFVASFAALLTCEFLAILPGWVKRFGVIRHNQGYPLRC